MPGSKKPDERAPNEEELERLAYDTMQSLGWLIPQTPADVARAEEALAEEPVELPESLRDPYAVLDAPPKERTGSPCPLAEGDAAELLARVAREGGTIPPEVEERMRRDREQAERKHDDDGQP
jgi:hypothetical protein